MDLDTLRRTLLQRLENDRRFGISHLPKSTGTFDLSYLRDVGAAPSDLPVDTSPAEETQPPSRTLVSGLPMIAPKAVAAPANLNPNVVPSTQSRAGRLQTLAVLGNQVAGCTRCEELAATRTQTVFGVGNPQAAILFLGEAPGADEDRTGEPFVGKAGQMLNRIIAACRLTREDIYIANILKCRPPGNRNPSPAEAANCREYLNAQIATVDPDYIVCWGRIAVENLLGMKDPIGKLRKRFFAYGRAKVAVTYHPSYLLRNPPAKKDVWDDMKWLFLDMGVDLDPNRKD